MRRAVRAWCVASAPAPRRIAREHDQRSDALAIQAKVLRAGDGEQHLGDPLRDQARACDVDLEIGTQPLVRKIDEGNKPALFDQLGDAAPLIRAQIGTGRVVAAGVQKHHRAGRQARQVRVHAIEVDPARSGVVVRIPLERQT